jgi:signal transduction histidine kinase/Tfp pilus assembly protein PilF
MTFKFILTVLLWSFFLQGKTQDCDTATINKLTTRADLELSKNVQEAYQLSYSAFSSAKTCPHTKHFYEAALSLTNAYYQKDQGDSIIALIKPVLLSLPANTSVYYKARLNHMLGSAYTMILQLENGLKHSLDALKGYEEIKDSAHASNMLVNVANIYSQQHNFKQAEKYLKSAIQIASRLRKKTALGNVYNTMGILYAENGLLDSAERFFLLSTKIREYLKDYTTLAWNYNNLGGIYTLMNKPSDAIIFFEKALKLFEENKNYDGQTSVANNIGELYLQKGNTKQAFRYFNYSRGLYSQTNNPDNLENLYGNLSDYYSKTGDFKTAKSYLDSLLYLKDSLSGDRLDRSMAEMQVKFDVEKKDLEIAKKKAELKTKEEEEFIKNIILLAVFILVVLMFAIGFLLYRKNQLEHRAKLDAEIALQKETRTKSILDAEEKERRRIAQDLHDGVGQLLSAAKLNLSNLESKLNHPSEEQRQAMQNALALVDDSVKEVRTVSHNMMPNTLIKLGLGSAVREFITKLGNAPNLKVDLEIIGLDSRLDNQTETVLYRVIQEIINNIIKHSKASHISMQLIRHETELSVMIEDNGIGFETGKMETFEGIGLKGIITRIEFLNGTVHFDSTIGRGTTVVIDVPIV